MKRRSSHSKEAVRSLTVVPVSEQSLPPQSVALCPEGILSPREMVGILRAEEDGAPVPPDVAEHLTMCAVCEENWAFVRATDPVLKKFREERVALVIQRVVGEEEFAPVGNAKSKLQPAEREALVQAVQQQLATAPGVPEESWFQAVLTESGEIPVDRVLEMCGAIQGIPDDKQRYESAKKLSAMFTLRVNEEQKRGILTLNIMDSLLRPASESIDLSELEVAVPIAAAFFASLPQTSYFSKPPLLEKSGDAILFHPARLSRFRTEFDRVRMSFDRQSALPQMAL